MKVLILSFLVILFDQVSKILVRLSLQYSKPYRLIGNWLRFRYIENDGMAMGLKVESQYFFIFFAFLTTIIIFVYLMRLRNESIQLRIALALILGGAIGNLIDRLLYRKVVDFIEVVISSKTWPIFNVADIAVFIGMGMLIYLVFFNKTLIRKNNELQQ